MDFIWFESDPPRVRRVYRLLASNTFFGQMWCPIEQRWLRSERPVLEYFFGSGDTTDISEERARELLPLEAFELPSYSPNPRPELRAKWPSTRK